MNWWALLSAMPAGLWCPLVLAMLAPVLLFIQQMRSRRHGTLARRVASQVALLVSVGFALLVVATGLVVFHAGLVNLATPPADDMALMALDVERVRVATKGDALSLRGRLALQDAVDLRTAWSTIGRTECTSDCVTAVSPRLSREDGERLHALARRLRDGDAWPAAVRGQVVKVLPVPLRDSSGTPDAVLLVGFDATAVATQATLASWAMLGALATLWAFILAGTTRAVGLLVSDRLSQLVQLLSASPPDGQPITNRSPEGADELKTLAAAIEVVADRAVRQQAQFRALIEHAPVGIARVNRHGQVLTANPRLLRLLAVEDVAELPAWTQVFVVPEEREQLLQAITGDTPLSGVLWSWQDQGARTRIVRASTVPLPADDAEPGAVLLVEDVTEQRASEAQMQRSQKAELVGRLAGGIAHDFNNLLTVVRGNVAAMGGVTASPELGAIDDAAARGARLVRRLLTISRSDHLTRAETALGPLLHDVIGMVRSVLPPRIRVDAPLEVPAVSLLVDRDAVEQSLLNLALNARDAIDETGAITFGARIERAGDGGRALVVSVQDDGTGMPAHVLARASEPFFSTKPPDRGTGLGLSVVSSIMASMGGRLELTSATGLGTTAELWFPIAHDAAPATSHGAPGSADGDTGLRILLVDDEAAVRAATERVLRGAFGHAVVAAAGMDEALEYLAGGHHVDLVISDVMMPGGSGIDLLRAARASGITLPFLFVSGFAMESLEGVLDSDPATRMLTKPWSIADLERMVRETADLGQASVVGRVSDL